MSWTPTVLRAIPKPPVTEQEDALDALLDQMEVAGLNTSAYLDGKEPSAQLFVGASLSDPFSDLEV
ncbi:MAG: hypothetical protein DLM66_00160 [Candidatus Dormiibacter spiritus]|nr:MAG: hypothetical protein DLM66_00160 [Candidatus Dormibacteraeota bacterium]